MTIYSHLSANEQFLRIALTSREERRLLLSMPVALTPLRVRIPQQIIGFPDFQALHAFCGAGLVLRISEMTEILG